MNTSLALSEYTPHGFCLAWQPGLVWLEAASDILIALAYFSIPATLLLFLRRRRDLAFKPVFGLFAAFILACGTTHVLGAVTLWVPLYWLDGTTKAVTAVLSVAAAAALWPLVPRALALPSPALLREANAALAREVAQGAAVTARLQESEARLRMLYSRSPAALHAVDREGVLIDVSDRWLDLFGYEREDVVGRPMAQFYTPESAEVSQDHLAALRAGSALLASERRIRCRDGSERDVDLRLEIEHDARGQLTRVLAAVTDVTAAKEAQVALQAAETRLRHAQKMEAVGQLTGGIAHDFNNLLTAIMGSLELLAQRAPDERSAHLAANALEGSQRAARLVSQLLAFSRKQMLDPECLAPAEVVDGLQHRLQEALGDGIALHVEHDAALWPVTADRKQLEAAVLNLATNARDAAGGQGEVTIRLANVSLDRAALTGAAGYLFDSPQPPGAGDYVCLSVVDTGCGMTPAVRARAFEPFFTTKAQGAGTGLGLSQLYGFVSQSGGAVRLRSAPGVGTVVEVVLPRGRVGEEGLLFREKEAKSF